MPGTVATPTCVDCKDADGAHKIRQRLLCAPCFKRYVNSKILKRMESYRIKNQTGTSKPRLLLALSGGASSMVLLSVLDDQLQKQLSKQNRTAYDLVIVHVDTSHSPSRTTPTWYFAAAQRFPQYTFLPPVHISSAFSHDHRLTSTLSHLGLPTPTTPDTPQSTYHTLLSACTTRTTLTDIEQIVLTRLLAALARTHTCTSLLLSHSDTRLASQSLSAVAKGRGGAAPGSSADGYSAGHGVEMRYPCRDLFRAELELFASSLEERAELAEGEGEDPAVAAAKVPSVKSLSIDELLAGYITSQGERYPSIMANVVRTVGKLQSEEPGVEEGQGKWCAFCRGAILSAQEGDREELCYGCTRMRQDIKIR
ncbi:uncharacterized protein HMPREF1541_09684 [Cyphellophora europaea CBS 101466]|uniref:Cytoplasmic tRNA 2-thiolation protein 2 n=1 Tax=Cyphellophora europaea (strain CBS 101466) TaxID=1220924 RepID=W2SA74_CYPE1|nr:uncharacterized protein HMPREF1541_09684 [Cyphellophora europaea CBS 101466]ETN44809.1 hypothetical protein HMPREF1541_09684 [Cyphellophora europaea CBS 101466]